MIREWLRKWLGLQKGHILLIRQNGRIVQAFVPRQCYMDFKHINEPGSIIPYDGEYGPVEIQDLPETGKREIQNSRH